MNSSHPERWTVDGFELLWEPGPKGAKVSVTKDGLTVAAGVEGPPEAWPAQELIEHLAMETWHAARLLSEPSDRRKRRSK